MKIGNWDSDSGKTFIIAEIGCNHEGDYNRAEKMIDYARAAGADAVKFQVYIPEKLVDPAMPSLAPSHATQLERMKALQLTFDEYRRLAHYAKNEGIIWFASAFDEESVDLVAELAPVIKIASGEFTNGPLLKYAYSKGLPMIVSTGMAFSRDDWRPFLDMCNGTKDVAVLHCISSYPAFYEGLNLHEIGRVWGGIAGYSDHTIGTEACVVAVALGAKIIEKHFTDLPWDKRNVPGDHWLSADLGEFKDMVRRIRNVELMLKPWEGERPDAINRPMLRRDPETGLRMGKR